MIFNFKEKEINAVILSSNFIKIIFFLSKSFLNEERVSGKNLYGV